MKQPEYFKILNQSGKHHDHQYVDGLNILSGPFNDDPTQSCVKGRLYITTKEFIHEFYHMGSFICRIEFPPDPIFRMIQDPERNKWGTNMLILKERYPLDRVDTYLTLGIKFPSVYYLIREHYHDLLKHVLDFNDDHPLKQSFEIQDAMIECIENNNLPGLKLLVAKGFDIHLNDDELLRTSASELADREFCEAHRSYAQKEFEILQFLVDQGANIHAKDDYAFRTCARRRRYDEMKFLINRGANVNAGKSDALNWCCFYGEFEMVQYLVKQGADIQADELIYWSASREHLDIIKYLVEQGVDPHQNDEIGLRESAKMGRLETVRYFVEKGANIHAENDLALQLSLHFNRFEVAKYLIEKGADLSIITKANLSYLQRWGYDEFYQYLTKLINI